MKTLWRRPYEGYEDDLKIMKPISRDWTDWRCWRMLKVWTSPRHPGRRDSHGPGRHRTADQRSLNRPGRTWPDCASWETTRRQLGDNLVHLRSSEIVWDPRPINWNHIWNQMSWGKFGRSKMFLKFYWFYCIMCLCHKWPSALRLGFRLFWTVESSWDLINPWGFCTVTGEALARQSTGISKRPSLAT